MLARYNIHIHNLLRCSAINLLVFQIKEFNDAIDHPASGAPAGALMMAVCRGKVSEGIDFAVRNARDAFQTLL